MIPVWFVAVFAYLAIGILIYVGGRGAIDDGYNKGALLALMSPVWPLLIVWGILYLLWCIPGEVKELITIARMKD
jgi:hypothetical protein